LYGNNAPLHIIAVDEEQINSSKEPLPIEIDYARNTYVFNDQTQRFGDVITFNGTKLIITKNTKFKGQPNEKLLLQFNQVKQLSFNLLKALEVESTGKQSTVIELTLKNTVPQKGEDILNTLLKVYYQTSLADKNAVARNTLSFVEERLKLVTRELNAVEEGIKDFKTRESIVDIGEQGKLFLETVKENDEKINELNIQLSVLADIEKYVTGKGKNKVRI
jgi:hypothetical protein